MDNTKILIADREPKNLQILKESLENSTFQVLVAESGEDAFRKVQEEKPDLMISEVDLPDFNGFQLLDRLQRDPVGASLPIVFLTNRRDLDDRLKGLRSGVKDYMIKPLHVKEVVARVKMILRRIERIKTDDGENDRKIVGRLDDKSVEELLENYGVEHKTGILTLYDKNNRNGEIYFRDGVIVNARLGNFKAEKAVYQMLPWKSGHFIMTQKDIQVPEEITVSNLGLLLQGFKRIQERQSLVEQLPSTDTVFVKTPIFEQILRKKSVTTDAEKFISLFDGKKNVDEIIAESTYDDLKTLERINKLYCQGFIQPEKALEPKRETWSPNADTEEINITEEFQPVEPEADTSISAFDALEPAQKDIEEKIKTGSEGFHFHEAFPEKKPVDDKEDTLNGHSDTIAEIPALPDTPIVKDQELQQLEEEIDYISAFSEIKKVNDLEKDVPENDPVEKSNFNTAIIQERTAAETESKDNLAADKPIEKSDGNTEPHETFELKEPFDLEFLSELPGHPSDSTISENRPDSDTLLPTEGIPEPEHQSSGLNGFARQEQTVSEQPLIENPGNFFDDLLKAANQDTGNLVFISSNAHTRKWIITSLTKGQDKIKNGKDISFEAGKILTPGEKTVTIFGISSDKKCLPMLDALNDQPLLGCLFVIDGQQSSNLGYLGYLWNAIITKYPVPHLVAVNHSEEGATVPLDVIRHSMNLAENEQIVELNIENFNSLTHSISQLTLPEHASHKSDSTISNQ